MDIKACSVENAAETLGLEPEDVLELVKIGKLDAIQLKSKTIIPIVAIDNFLCGFSTNSSTNLDKGASDQVTSQQSKSKGDVEVSEIKVYFSKVKGDKKHNYVAQLVVGGERVKSKRVYSKEEGNEWGTNYAIEKGYLAPEEEVDNAKALSKNPLFRDYAEVFLKEGFGNGTSVTKKGYYDSMRPIANEIGAFRMNEITFDVVRKMFAKFCDKYVQSTINKQFLVLNKALTKAYKDELVPENVMSGFYDEYGKHNYEYPTSRIRKKPIVGFTDEEVKMLLEAAKKYPKIYPIIQVFLSTGIRPAELRGLLWENLNWEKKTITIDSRIVYEYDNLSLDYHSTPIQKSKDGVKKSRARKSVRNDIGIRELPLTDAAVEALKVWKEYVKSCGEYEYFKDSKYIFPSETCEFMTETALKKRFERFLKSSGLVGKIHYHPYRFRHTFCTRMALNGAPEAITKQMMGDSSSEIVNSVYTNIERETGIKIARDYIK